MQLSSTSILYALNKNQSPMLGTVVAPVVAIITCLKFRGSCVTMFMEQKNHSISVPLMYCLNWTDCQLVAAIFYRKVVIQIDRTNKLYHIDNLLCINLQRPLQIEFLVFIKIFQNWIYRVVMRSKFHLILSKQHDASTLTLL